MQSKYNHHFVEKNKFIKWKKKKYFSTHDLSKKAFSILLPPPNVTGVLHIGHALNAYLSDTIIRYKKLTNFDVLFLPSKDHAGIATQIKVEKSLAQDGLSKHDLTRQQFLDLSWKWTQKHAKIIDQQWAKLGLALDFEAERFTLDHLSHQAVNQVFLEWYQKGIIYRAYKGINWDPQLRTTLSNIELETREEEQNFYYIKYPIKNSSKFLTIATVRPETLYSDVALVYHPQDERFRNLKEQQIMHPLLNKTLKIITDEYVDPQFGSGLMKLSAHDINDIEIIKKQNLEVIESIDDQGFLTSQAQEFAGLDRFQGRKAIVAKLKKLKLLEKVEKTVSVLNFSSRSGAQTEILAKKQWFVKMDYLSQLLIQKQKQNGINFFPKRFEKTLLRWMDNLYDWPISRQLLWGHQIPAWYFKDQTKVQLISPGPEWKRDTDVLDTWFSSGLAAFSFLGWPQKSLLLERFFPISLLVTGYDIIFFWVARMYFSSLYFMHQKPFHEVLLNGLVRDQFKRKMSKSLNNGIDPLKVIADYGSDALRFFLLTNSSPGLDLAYSKTKVEAAWNLQNKLWNISRFIETLESKKVSQSKYDRWILYKFSLLVLDIDTYLNKYEFTLVGKSIYQFMINDLSSAYLEFAKVFPNRPFLKKLLHDFLILVHPFMPFLSDHLFFENFQKEVLESSISDLIINAKEVLKSEPKEALVDQLVKVISALRKFRQTNRFTKNDLLHFAFKSSDFDFDDIKIIEKLTKAKLNKKVLPMQIDFIEGKQHLLLSLPSQIEDQKLQIFQKQKNFLEFEIARAQKILANPHFLEKAPKDKVNLEKEKLSNYQEQLKELENE